MTNTPTLGASRAAIASPLLTWSRMRTFRACPRKHFYRYEQRIRPVAADSLPLRFGSLMHAGLEVWWSTPDVARAGAAMLSALNLHARQHEDDEYLLASARAVAQGYHARWAAEHTSSVPEIELTAPLVNPTTGRASRLWRRAAKIDALMPRGGLGVALIEHKTTSEDLGPNGSYWKRLRIDGQVSHYLDVCHAQGYDVVGVLYDVVRRPAQQPLKATPLDKRRYVKKSGALDARQRLEDETPAEYGARIAADVATRPDYYYQRGRVVRLDEDMREYRLDVWQTARAIREAQLAGAWPRNPDACMTIGRGTCEFFEVCTGAASIDDEALFVRGATAHAELSAEIQNPKEEGADGNESNSSTGDRADTNNAGGFSAGE